MSKRTETYMVRIPGMVVYDCGISDLSVARERCREANAIMAGHRVLRYSDLADVTDDPELQPAPDHDSLTGQGRC